MKELYSNQTVSFLSIYRPNKEFPGGGEYKAPRSVEVIQKNNRFQLED